MEDWALIRRLAAEGVPEKQIAERLGISRTTVVKAVASSSPPKSVRDVYLADNYADAAVLLDKAIAGCLSDEVAEIRSLGTTLASWRTEILARHKTGASKNAQRGGFLVSAGLSPRPQPAVRQATPVAQDRPQVDSGDRRPPLRSGLSARTGVHRDRRVARAGTST